MVRMQALRGTTTSTGAVSTAPLVAVAPPKIKKTHQAIFSWKVANISPSTRSFVLNKKKKKEHEQKRQWKQKQPTIHIYSRLIFQIAVLFCYFNMSA